MVAKLLVALVAAAIGAVAGIGIGYVVYEHSASILRVSFMDWLTHRNLIGGMGDGILWGILGAGVGALLSLLHK